MEVLETVAEAFVAQTEAGWAARPKERGWSEEYIQGLMEERKRSGLEKSWRPRLSTGQTELNVWPKMEMHWSALLKGMMPMVRAMGQAGRGER